MQMLGLQLVLTGLGVIIPLTMSMAGHWGAIVGGLLLLLLNGYFMFRGAQQSGGLAAWYRKPVHARRESPALAAFAGLFFLLGGVYFALFGEPGNGPNPMTRFQIIIFSLFFVLIGVGIQCLVLGRSRRR